jgi:hypothetical protein
MARDRDRDRLSTGGVLVLGRGQALPTKRSKYGNVRTAVAGRTFDSKHEANRYLGLLALERAGEIKDLECQVRYRITVNDEWICDYVADFVYVDCRTNRIVVEDAKSEATRKIPLYQQKKRLMHAVHKVEIIEV